MKRISITASVLLATLICCSESFAQCNCQPSLADAYRAGIHANVHWPRIYIPPARRAVYSTYDAMVNNGWRRQNLLGNYHFSEDTNELTQAGKLKVNWILSQAPVHRRGVFVQRGENVDQTAARVGAVHDMAANISPSVGTVEVNDTHIVAEGRTAGAVDNLFVSFKANQPPPVLQSKSGSSTSTGE